MVLTLIALALSSAPPSAAAQQASADGDKKVCRRYAETGSFVRHTKVCRTKAEWRRIEQDSQEEGRRMQSQLSTERGG